MDGDGNCFFIIWHYYCKVLKMCISLVVVICGTCHRIKSRYCPMLGISLMCDRKIFKTKFVHIMTLDFLILHIFYNTLAFY